MSAVSIPTPTTCASRRTIAFGPFAPACSSRSLRAASICWICSVTMCRRAMSRCNSARGLWCAIQVVGAERSLEALSGDALRHRHPEPGHPVEHRAADPGFGLLGRQCPGAQAATDDSFVAEHGGLPKRAPAVADRLLPAQAPLVPDRLDVLVPLTGRGARGRARHGG